MTLSPEFIRLSVREIDRRVFVDIVPRAIQSDGQRLIDAMQAADSEALRKLARKYQRDCGLAQGGGGAGPGKMKHPRRGALIVGTIARDALDRINSPGPAR